MGTRREREVSQIDSVKFNFNLGRNPLQRTHDHRVYWFSRKLNAAVAVCGEVPIVHLEGPLARLLALLDEMLRPTLFEERYRAIRDAAW